MRRKPRSTAGYQLSSSPTSAIGVQPLSALVLILPSFALAWKPADRWYHIVATRSEDDGSYTINNGHTAISLGPDGRPHILYSLLWENTLWYAVFDSQL